MRSAFIFILLFCTSGQSLADSIWEVSNESHAPAANTSTPHLTAEDIWESDDSVTYSASADSTRPAQARRQPRKKKRVVRAKRVTTARRAPPAARPAPRPVSRPAVKPPPVIARRQAPPRPVTTQAALGTADTPLNLRSGNTSTFFPTPLLQRQAVCTDIIACIARANPPSATEQARALAQIASIEAMQNWKPPTPANATTTASPLPYARHLAQFFQRGRAAIKRGSGPQCAKAVRFILAAAGLLDPTGHPGSAYQYVSFLQRKGFRHNPAACNTPGVVRVHGHPAKNSRYYRRNGSTGDTHGHVEILGLDGKYHHFTSSSSSIQQLFSVERRPLIGCMVKENWRAR